MANISAVINGSNDTQEFRVKPLAPTTLAVVATGAENQVVVFWDEVAGATGYKLYRSEGDESASANANPADGIEFTSDELFTLSTTNQVVNLPAGIKSYFLVTAIVNTVESNTNSQQAVATANAQIFATVSGNGNTVWMDRNLGAERVATSFTDSDAFSDYYQWGRASDGHQLLNSATTGTPASNITPNNAQFFVSGSMGDWTASGVDNNGVLRAAVWGSIDGSGICPTGFRVPLIAELTASAAGGFTSSLKLPAGGYRSGVGTGYNSITLSGAYWSNTVGANTTQSQYLIVEPNGNAFASDDNHIEGNSIRCIRDAAATAAPTIIIPVASIAITSRAAVSINTTTDLTARVLPANANDLSLNWTIESGGSGSATLVENALTTSAEGEIIVRATSVLTPSVFATQTITISLVPAESVSITSPDFIGAGFTLTLTAAVSPTITAQAVSWAIPSVSQQSIATINGNILTAIAPGSVIIQVSADNGTDIIATQTFTVRPTPASGITITSAALVGSGSELTLTATVAPPQATDKTVAWSISAGGNFASINGNTLSGVAIGTVTVVASANGGTNITAEQTIRVLPAAPSNLKALATGVPNQVIIFWSAVADASGYQLYQSASDLSAAANTVAATATELSAITPISTTATSTVIDLAAGEQAYFLVTAMVGADTTFTNAEQAAARAHDFAFNTATGAGNSVWMDRNLGAAQVATAKFDAAGFGDYYQWGRPADGHQLKDSAFTSTQANSISPGHAEFIGNDNWLASGVDANRSQRQAIWSRIDGSGICPTGFKVPSIGNLDTESFTWSPRNNDGAFASNLKLPSAGNRNTNGAIADETQGGYWTTSIGTVNVVFLWDSTIFYHGISQGFGLSVRCIRDASLSAAPTITIPISSFAITSPISVLTGETLALTADVLPNNANQRAVVWSIEGGNNAIASLDGNTLTSLTVGSVVVVASTDGGNRVIRQTISISDALVASITISSANSVNDNTDLTLQATVLPAAAAQTVSWSILSGENFASINGNIISGIAPGEVVIIASASDSSGVTGTQTFSVNEVLVSSLLTAPVGIKIGETATLSVQVFPTTASNPAVIYSIQSGENFATLNGDILTGTAPGTGQISVTAADSSGATALQHFTISLQAPENLTSLATGVANQVRISWSAVNGASRYKLYHSATNLSGHTNVAVSTLGVVTFIGINESAATSQIVDLTAGQQAYFLVTAISGSNESFTNAEQAVVTPHNLEFGIAFGADRTVWMDRNLGAAQVATATDDTLAFGDLYQWGRAADGHQLRNSATSGDLAQNISPNNANFITPISSSFDWTAAGVDTDGSARSEFWSRLDGSGICPAGFRVPSIDELAAERASWNDSQEPHIRDRAFASDLKWTSSTTDGGRRLGTDGTLDNIRTPLIGFYWSNTTDTESPAEAFTLNFGRFSADTDDSYEYTFGQSVRCIRNTKISAPPAAPGMLRAIATGVPNQALIYWSAVGGATNYKLHQSNTDLSAFAGGTPPTTATALVIETAEITQRVDLAAGENYFLLTATNPIGESATNAEQAIVVGSDFEFNTVSGTGNRVWIDRNLGASRVAISSTDTMAFGDYYQWGRAADGHQLENSPVQAGVADANPAHNRFFTPSSANESDWTSDTFDANGSQREAFWSKTDGSGVCPIGFRVPIAAELEAERILWPSPQRASGGFASSLKWANNGRRNPAGNQQYVGDEGYVWSAERDDTAPRKSFRLYFGAGNSHTINDQPRSAGLAIRCIRDADTSETPIIRIPVSSLTITSPNALLTGETLTLTAEVLPNNANQRAVVWSISTNSAVSLGADGITITALAVGSAVVTATSDGGNIVSTQTISIRPAAPSALKALATGAANQIVAYWPEVSGASGYKLYQSANNLSAHQNAAADSFRAISTAVTENFAVVNLGVAAEEYLLVTAIVNGAESKTNSTQTVVTAHNFTFGTVAAADGKIWLDRDLGAQRVPENVDDELGYGDYYQWGRRANGHQLATSNQISPKASTIRPEHGDFIGGGGDWLEAGIDDDTLLRQAVWNILDGSSVCPAGFKVPNNAEWATVLTARRPSVADAFSSILKLPTAADRGRLQRKDYGSYWLNESGAQKQFVVGFGGGLQSSNLSTGNTIRCLRDDSFSDAPVIQIAAESIAISSLGSVLVGETLTLEAAVLPNNAATRTFSWTLSGDNSIASLSGNVITAVSVGEVIATATIDGGTISASQTITVAAELVSSIAINSANTLIDGETLTLTAEILPAASSQVINWSIKDGDNSIASISGNLLTAVAPGLVTVVASADDSSGISVEQEFSVIAVLVSAINIESNNSVINGESITLVARVSPANASAQNVIWSITAGTGLATISGNILTASRAGEITLVATADDANAVSQTQQFTIHPAPVASVEITSPAFVENLASLNLIATVLPSVATEANNVIWSIENGDNSIASIGFRNLNFVRDGQTVRVRVSFITGISPGSVILVATAGGISATQPFTVNPILVSSINIDSSDTLFQGLTLDLQATVSPANATLQTVSWSIENGNNAIASIDGNTLTAISAGTVTVVASADDTGGITATQTFTVTNTLPAPATLIAAAVGAPNQVVIYWTEVSGASGYNLYQHTEDLSAFTDVETDTLPAAVTEISTTNTFVSIVFDDTATYHFVVAATLNGNKSKTNLTQTAATAHPLTFRAVTSGDNRIWLDRNLGAQRVAIGRGDIIGIGDYYQWGRPRDGHQIVGAGTTGEIGSSLTPNHSLFIRNGLGGSGVRDWVAPGVDDDFSARTAFLNKTDGSSGLCCQ
ncbi:MAG: hypothetical protein HAW58_02260 [Candidatus Thioglobus sp.]|nr:hypothetical protein [Candidatus Thioglobus sp.]